jgi:hypothetical protein
MGEDYSERWATIDRNGGRHHLGIDGRLAPEAAPRARLPGNNRAAARNLKYMRAFAEAWPDLEFVQQVVALLPWGHSMTAIRQVVRLKLTLDGIEPKVRTLVGRAAEDPPRSAPSNPASGDGLD